MGISIEKSVGGHLAKSHQKKIVGVFVQCAVITIVTKHADALRLAGGNVLQRVEIKH
jgi:hypothetical protein